MPFLCREMEGQNKRDELRWEKACFVNFGRLEMLKSKKPIPLKGMGFFELFE